MSAKPSAQAFLRTWKCPQCRVRDFSTSARRSELGPEHPRYIKVPLPPQQGIPHLRPVKGSLPVPRDIFVGEYGKVKADEAEISRAAANPTCPRNAVPGSRTEWRHKMADARRRNLREGLDGLRVRRESEIRRQENLRGRKANEKRERLSRPQREDERLTMASLGLDFEALMSGRLEDPGREERIAKMKANVARTEAAKQETRTDHLHTLYSHARTFIVTPAQLDKSLDEVFGTPEKPFRFGQNVVAKSGDPKLDSDSMWVYGPPMTVQDMLDKANGRSVGTGLESSSNFGQINRDRIRRVVEGFTGGTMDDHTQ